MWDINTYKWFYDNILCYFYELIIKWCFLPFGGERKFREEMIKEIKFNEKEKILDMCCGTGGNTFSIAERVGKDAEIIGIDLSLGQINIAKKRNKFNNIKFIEKNAMNTGFETNYFDKVFIAHALHELPREMRINVLKEAKRLLKPKFRILNFSFSIIFIIFVW